MRIVIDMQGAQAQSRARGIGRYTSALVRGLIRQSNGHELILVLNGRFPETLEPLRNEFSQWLPHSHIRVWHAPGPVYQLDPRNQVRWQCAEALYEHYLASLAPDCVLVTSLFEGIGDEAVTSVGQWCPELPVACVLYDLIPLIYPHLYLENETHRRWYHEKLDHLRRSHLLLSISESSRQEAIQHLTWPASRVVNMSSAAEHNFCPISIGDHRESVLREFYGLHRPFVMYTGGIDHRKNVDRLIEAYAALPEALRSQHQLAIVCAVHDAERRRLESLARQFGLDEGDLVLTGYIPEHDLVELYNLCQAFVFPSVHEGFGLPALEAMSCGAPVIGSNRSSLPEVIGIPEALFDPEDTADMAARLERVLTDPSFRESLMSHGRIHAANFSWDNTASAAIRALEQRFDAAQSPAEVEREGALPTLAMVSPLPPQRSGISDYTVELLQQLRHHYRISLVVQKTTVELPGTLNDLPVLTVETFRERAGQFDRVLYQFGNSEFHQHMFALLREIPGVVVLHDFFLSGVLAWDDVHGSRTGAWKQALFYSHGYKPLAELAAGEEPSEVIWRYPANLEVIQQAQRVIVHAPVSVRMARSWYGSQAADSFVHIPLLREPASPQAGDAERARQALDLPSGDLVVCSFGFLGGTKLNHELVRAWNQSALARSGKARLVFVGGQEPGPYSEELSQLISQGPDPSRVRVTGWVDMETYRHYLVAADIGVQLRTRSRGETSASVLDCLNYGLATVINANGSMADIPEDAVLRLPDEFTVEQLTEALDHLYHHPGEREELAANGRQLVHEDHAPAECARSYQRAIEAAYEAPANRAGQAVQSVAQVLADAPREEQSDYHQLVADIDWCFPPAPRFPVLMFDISDHLSGEHRQNLSQYLLEQWLDKPPSGFRVEPVWFDELHGQYRFARQWASEQMNALLPVVADDTVSFAPGDALIDLDLGMSSRDRLRHQYHQLAGMGVFTHVNPEPQPHDANARFIADRLVKFAADMSGSAGPRLLVDISELVRLDAGTGIQRVVKQIIGCWLEAPPGHRQVCLVYSDPAAPGYRHANRFTLNWRSAGYRLLPDTPVSWRQGDIFVGLDLQPNVVPNNAHVYRQMRELGVTVWFVLYDLIAVSQPHYFVPGARATFSRWLEVVTQQGDGVVAISRSVKNELEAWLQQTGWPQEQWPELAWFHLGADPVPQTPEIENEAVLPVGLASFESPTFLMVGTIEPRKGHAQALEAFEQFWQDGLDYRLVIVGKKGWLVDDFAEALLHHPEIGRRLFWLDTASDAQLELLYQGSHALLAGSWAEGFGLPLIEAARHGLPLVVRDIPVFREVAGEHAWYFQANTGEELARQLRHWVSLYQQGTYPQVEGLNWLSWQDSARALEGCLGLVPPVDEAPLSCDQAVRHCS